MGQLEATLKRLRQMPNDQTAWGELFRLTWPFVVSLCHRSLPAARRVLEADDVAQEVYFKFARYWKEKRPSIEDRDTLFSLLAVMTRQLARDAIRWETRARRDVGKEQSLSETQTDDGRHELAEIELLDLLDKVCSALDPSDSQVLSLRLQGYELSEIAEKLDVSIRTIERKLRGIRDVLRPHLELDDVAYR